MAAGVLSVALILLGGVGHAAEGPFVDVRRSIEKQREAADAAAKTVAKGTAAVAEVLALLADPSGLVRDRVVEEVLRRWSDEDLLALAAGLAAREPLTQEGVAEVLGRRMLGTALPALVQALGRQRDEGARVVCLWAIGQVAGAGGGGSEAVPAAALKAVEAVLEKEKQAFRVRGEALATLVKLDPDGVSARLRLALAERMLPLRVVALDLLAARLPGEALPAARAQLALPDDAGADGWPGRVRLAALDLLVALALDPAERGEWVALIEQLIPRIDVTTGRERDATLRVLRRVAGPDAADLPAQSFAWDSWWRAQRESWQPGGGGQAPARSGAGLTGVVRYHGEVVDARAVTFLIDLSGGMERPLVEGGEGPSRLELARTELTRVLRELDGKTLVNVIAFGSYPERYQEAPVVLEAARARLLDWVARRELSRKPGHNRGNIYDTLVQAITQPGADTVFLLTEGGPTEGKYQDNGRFLAHLERWNRYHRVRIHTQLVGRTGGRARDLLRQLAERSGGTYRDLTEAQGSGG